MHLPGVDPEKFYSLAEVFVGVGIRSDTLGQWHAEGRLPLTRIGRRRVALGRDLEALVAEPALPPGFARPRSTGGSRQKIVIAALAKYGMTVGGSPTTPEGGSK